MARIMKDSGIQWIGDIPKDWELNKINSLYSERNTKVSDKDYPPLSVTKKGILPQLKTVAKTDNGDNRKLVKANDFVINSRSDRRGSCGISNFDGSVSLINIVLKPYQNMNNLYYNFVFHTECFADEFYRWGNGIVDDLWSTRWFNMKNIYIPYPPIEEQQHITNYLNEKCSEIASLRTDIEKEIAMLENYKQSLITETVTKGLNPNVEMKNSGVQWIGSIPQHWETMKIKYSCFLKGRIGWQGLTAKEYQDDGAYLITGTDFKNGFIDWNTCVHISEERYQEAPEIHIKENDLLITKDGTIGKVAITKNTPQKVSLNSGVLLIRQLSNNKYIEKYLYYCLLSNIFWTWFNNNKPENSTILHLYQEQFKEFIYTLPLIEEQEEIVKYLDEKCTEIDAIINGKKRQLATLEDYKKSLIYEYVTGKKEVYPDNSN